MAMLADTFARALAERISSVRWMDGELVATPWDFDDGRTLDLYVEEVSEGNFLVTDRGLVADRLADANVDLSHASIARSWNMVRHGLTWMGADVGPFEVAATSSRDQLGATMREVSMRALQADGLKVLSRTRSRRTYAEQAMAVAAEHRLGVIPRSQITNRFGAHRRVSFAVGTEKPLFYVMALAGAGGFMEDHDRAKVAFVDAAVSAPHRISVIGPGAHPDAWQMASLREVSTVVLDRDADAFWSKVAA